MIHVSVLLNETIQALNPHPGMSYLDATLGASGHALAMAKATDGKIKIVGIDAESRAIENAKQVLTDKVQSFIPIKGNFKDMQKLCEGLVPNNFDAILMDLGISSDELEASGRGFSFKQDEPLLMTLNDEADGGLTARDIVNNFDEAEIASIIYEYGEERNSRRIAKAIVDNRKRRSIETSGELAEIIYLATHPKFRNPRIHPATKTFQALRIAVNRELENLQIGLEQAWNMLEPKGRLVVISFHSLEDRIVKNFFKAKKTMGANILNKKPIIAGEAELKDNPRARSAKLRAIEKNTNTNE